MTKQEFLLQAGSFSVDKNKIAKIKELYTGPLPEILEKIISNSNESVYFDDGVRILSYAEILDAKRDLQVDFTAKGIIPVADCGENDFIVYDYNNSEWGMFNIVDEIMFKKCSTLEDLI